MNLTYQQTVDVLLGHGADVSASNYQVSFLETCYAGVTGVAAAHVYCMLIVVFLCTNQHPETASTALAAL